MSLTKQKMDKEKKVIQLFLEKEEENIPEPKRSILEKVKYFIVKIWKDTRKFITKEVGPEELNQDIERYEKENPMGVQMKKITTPIFQFSLGECRVIIQKKIISAAISHLSNFVPFLKDRKIVNVYFNTDSDNTDFEIYFPTIEEIEKNVNMIHYESRSLFLIGDASEAQEEFIKNCRDRKLKSDRFFIHHCLEKELRYIEHLKEIHTEEAKKKKEEENKRFSYKEPSLLRKDFYYFEVLQHLIKQERKYQSSFKDDPSLASLMKTFEDLLTCYKDLKGNPAVYKNLYGVLPVNKVFSRAENVFYGFDPLVSMVQKAINLNSRRIQFAPHKKSLFPDDPDGEELKSFVLFIKREQEVLTKVLRILGEWEFIRSNWAFDTNVKCFIEITVCPKRHQKIVSDIKGYESKQDFYCCDEEGKVLGICYLGDGERPEYCSC